MRRHISAHFSKALLAVAALGLAGTASAAAVSLTFGTAYTQNFDGLVATGTATTNTLTLPGWSMTEGGGGARDNEQYAVDNGTATTGDTYSYGTTGSSDRALGSLRSGTLIPLFGAQFTNGSAGTLTSLLISYFGEEWRLGTAGRTDRLDFQYSLNALSLDGPEGSWIDVNALDFVTPDTATVGIKNGNLASERTSLSSTITGLNIAAGASFWIRWQDFDATGADDGLAIDDFSITANGVTPNSVPEPESLALAGLALGALVLSSRKRKIGS